MNFEFRQPDRYADPISARSQKKWTKIFNTFMDSLFDELKQIHRTGTRGRLFAFLVKNMLGILQIPHDTEPIFGHIAPNKWYLDFASRYDLKIRTHDFYNPDYILSDGVWFEITLSENTAYQKLFRYGHEASKLKVIWFDEDTGLHKKACEGIEFPNAQVIDIQEYFQKLEITPEGCELINKFHELKRLKGIIR